MKTNHISFRYGRSHLPLIMPPEAQLLSHTEPPETLNPEDFQQEIRAFMDKRDGSLKSVGIVVSDKTRLCEYPVYLPMLTGALAEYGIKDENITFYIAYGTHAPQSEEECLYTYGETYSRYRFVHHDARDESRMVYLGKTSRGTEVKIARAVTGHDLLITFGAILHHYFAGFGGGRKLLFPGNAEYRSILHNHQLFLDHANRKLSDGCESGNLDTNPLALDLEEINTFLPERLEIHAILNSSKQICDLFTGTSYAGYRNACERYDRYFRVPGNNRYDLVVAGGGGYPKDINFIQAHKAIHNAASFVKDGGNLIILAECIDGIGNPDFMDFFNLGGWEELFQDIKKEYRNNAATAVAMMDKTRRIKIHFVTSLDQKSCEMMDAFKISPDEAQQLVEREKGEMAWIENAGLLYI